MKMQKEKRAKSASNDKVGDKTREFSGNHSDSGGG